jgi:hypothetical protein
MCVRARCSHLLANTLAPIACVTLAVDGFHFWPEESVQPPFCHASEGFLVSPSRCREHKTQTLFETFDNDFSSIGSSVNERDSTALTSTLRVYPSRARVASQIALLLTLSLTVGVPSLRSPCCTRSLDWRRGSESNRRIRLLQSPALPLGYPADGVPVKIGHAAGRASGSLRRPLIFLNNQGNGGCPTIPAA